MRREILSDVIGNIDDRLIAEAYQFDPARCNYPAERTRPLGRKRLLALALAAALLLSLGAVAYAANLFGLRELYANPGRGEMPEEAAALIVEQGAEIAGDGWRARVMESYCDESTVLLTVQSSADAEYLVAPTDADPMSPLWVIGLTGEGTLGDYARWEGKTLLLSEAVPDGEALGLLSGGMRFESASPQEMTIFFEGARNGVSPEAMEASCTIIVVKWPPDADPMDPDAIVTERREVPVTFSDGGGKLLGVYSPTDPFAVPGLELGDLRLTQTPLGISLRLRMTPRDLNVAQKLLTLRLEGVAFHGDGVIRSFGTAIYSQGQGDFGDSPTIQFLDWDKNILAEVTFEKIG